MMRHFDVRQRENSDSVKAIDSLQWEAGHRNDTAEENGNFEKQKPKQKGKRIKEFRFRQFLPRNSPLTDLLKVSHIRAVYNISLGLLIYQYLCLSVVYYADYDKMVSHLSMVAWLFGKFKMVCYVWFTMTGSVLLLYPVFRYWISSRRTLHTIGLYDFMFLTSYVSFQAALMFFPGRIIRKYDVPMLSSLFIVLEQLRLVMKCHSFVRENASKAFGYQPHHDDDVTCAVRCPDFGKFLYFLFAPTLIYQDYYPRTPYIRWGQIIIYVLEIIGCCLAGYIWVLLVIKDTFKNFCKEPTSLAEFAENFAAAGLAGVLFMLLMFYGLLHCWLNAWAEVLRFEDKMFYQDWWNLVSYAFYFRSWNTVIHDWLHSYIYRDVCLFLKASKGIGFLIVFMVSGLAHEYILSMTLKFTSLLYFTNIAVISAIVVHVTRSRTSPLWNLFFWATIFLGCGILVTFYSMEWFARINNPGTVDSWHDYVVPRFSLCPFVWS